MINHWHKCIWVINFHTLQKQLRVNGKEKETHGCLIYFSLFNLLLHFSICLDINIDHMHLTFFSEIQLLQASLERYTPTFLLNSNLSHKCSDIIHIWHFVLKKALTMWQVCICWMQRSSQCIVMGFDRDSTIGLYENCEFWWLQSSLVVLILFTSFLILLNATEFMFGICQVEVWEGESLAKKKTCLDTDSV